ncbi:iron-siderophore ABC transporter substrate-binding protein [Nocardiopsis sp. HUAS JQ3]|uniref:iron-siderophore ABC transporter substrate-binding protein n=1 Tax=Nocardiopsis sp. HUAS JQ3 TaxID=3061629 RepID=UPI0023A98EF2|nr:iron-siderophore ABC transporter substrate-binding protein [Nocardiopsis sp. HUAS JQ3]WDZ88381.1 iron-siderophore ABC transporter substrate-binding protein [Nocardiopsis sp. HUAS JQ3]
MPELSRPVCALATLTALAALTLSGCAAPPDPRADQDGPTRTVQAANGSVEIPATPQRVAVLWRPTLAAATLLGHDVAATMGTPGAPEQGLAPFLPPGADGDALTLATNSPAEDDVNIEELANAAPDLIIGVHTQSGAQAQMLANLEAIAPTVLLEWEGTGSWREHLHQVAEVLDTPEQAEQAVAEYETALEQARQQITGAGVDPAATEVSLVRLQSQSEIRLETPASFPGQIVQDLGLPRPQGQTQAQGETDFIALGYEHLERADGDAVFVLAGSGYPDAPRTFSAGVWSNLRAVRDERIYRMDHDVWGAANHHAAHRIIQDVTRALTGQTAPAV